MRINKRKSTDADLKRKIVSFHIKNLIISIIIIPCIIASMLISFRGFTSKAIDNLEPQICRAVAQAAKLLPQIENNDEALRDVYEKMKESRSRLSYNNNGEDSSSTEEIAEDVSSSLSWMERITKLKVGRNGYVMVVSKNDGTVLAHPDDSMVGNRIIIANPENGSIKDEDYRTDSGLSADISIEELDQDITPDKLNMRFHLILQEGSDSKVIRSFNKASIGYVAAYKDKLIICGVEAKEVISFVLTGLGISMISVLLLWIFVRYVRLHLKSLTESESQLRSKFFAFSVIMTAVVFVLSSYVQILSNMIYDLKTMEKHAQVAVETLNSYREIRTDINEWLDEQYLEQCRVAAENIANTKDEDITREYLKNLAELLEVKHIYLFDKNGRTVVTNSPHDHFELSNDKESQSYAFRVLLDGADHVIQEPCKNDVLGEYMQYIGVSIRDENDLCSGFVQIGIDPSLRDRLTKPFDVDTVLNNLVIGLPEHALAVDKETLTIKETTGPGFKGESVEKLGITNDNLISRLSSSLWINGREYYAGFGEASDVYLVPIVPRSGYIGSFFTSCWLAVLTFACMSAVSFIALRKYDEYAAVKRDSEPVTTEGETSGDNAVPDEDDETDNGILSGFSEFIKQDKYMFEERWNIAEREKDKQNPETRIRFMIYRILAVVCIINLFPALYCKLFGVNNYEDLNGLSYIIMGQWEKGLNIFAVSSCIFLLFALYIFIVVTDRILYGIAKISDTRVETVCLLIRSSLKYICACVFVYFGLSKFGIATQTLLASAGILSLIIGLGAKDLVNDIIAGFFIIFEGTLKVGDFVTLGNWSGTVTQVGLRTTKITFFADTKIINNSVIKDIINTNGTVARKNIKFPVSYEADLLYVEEILERELPLLTEKISDLLKPPKYGGVSSVEDSCILLRITVYALPYKANKVQRAVMRELILIFNRYGIDIPYPQITVHNASGEHHDVQENNEEQIVPVDTYASDLDNNSQGERK